MSDPIGTRIGCFEFRGPLTTVDFRRIRSFFGDADEKAMIAKATAALGRMPRDGEEVRIVGIPAVFREPAAVSASTHHGLCDGKPDHAGPCRCRCGGLANRVMPRCGWHTDPDYVCACGAVSQHPLAAGCGFTGAAAMPLLPCTDDACPVTGHPYGHPHIADHVRLDELPRALDYADWCWDHRCPGEDCATRLHDTRRHPDLMPGQGRPCMASSSEAGACYMLAGHSGSHRSATGVEWADPQFAYDAGVVERNQRLYAHEAATPMRGHTDECCAAAADPCGDTTPSLTSEMPLVCIRPAGHALPHHDGAGAAWVPIERCESSGAVHQLPVDHDAPGHDRAYCMTCDNRAGSVAAPCLETMPLTTPPVPCVRPAGHELPHRDRSGAEWVPVDPPCGDVSGEHVCSLAAGHTSPHLEQSTRWGWEQQGTPPFVGVPDAKPEADEPAREPDMAVTADGNLLRDRDGQVIAMFVSRGWASLAARRWVDGETVLEATARADVAERELRARELHHFETEQILTRIREALGEAGQ